MKIQAHIEPAGLVHAGNPAAQITASGFPPGTTALFTIYHPPDAGVFWNEPGAVADASGTVRLPLYPVNSPSFFSDPGSYLVAIHAWDYTKPHPQHISGPEVTFTVIA